MIILNGDRRIPAHVLVLFTRCKDILDEVIIANGSKYHERWSHLSQHVVTSFLSYLYCGTIELELITSEDLDSAKYFSTNYSQLLSWKLYVENYIDQVE